MCIIQAKDVYFLSVVLPGGMKMRKYVHCTVIDSEKSGSVNDFEYVPHASAARPKPSGNIFGFNEYRDNICSFAPNPSVPAAPVKINLYA